MPAEVPGRPPSPRGASLYTELISRLVSGRIDPDTFAREAEALLTRYEEQAQQRADRLVIDARVEAARILTEARREVASLSAKIDALQAARPAARRKPSRTARHPWWVLGTLAAAVAVLALVRWMPGLQYGTALDPEPARSPSAAREPGTVATRPSAAATPSSPASSATSTTRARRRTDGRAVVPRPEANEASATPRPSTDGRPAAPAPAPAASTAAASTADDHQAILQADREWFDAFYAGNRTAMGRRAASGFELVDTRAPDRRPPAQATPARRLSDVSIDVHGGGAVLSARMHERVPGDGGREYVSYVSEVWVKPAGEWRLLGVRLAGADEIRRASEALR